jgi:hypothetical protein
VSVASLRQQFSAPTNNQQRLANHLTQLPEIEAPADNATDEHSTIIGDMDRELNDEHMGLVIHTHTIVNL